MSHLPNKAAKDRKLEGERQRNDLRANGYTVFRFDFAPRFTRANLSLGDAFRELLRVTRNKAGFWRCPIRGLAMEFNSAPTTTYIYDRGTFSRSLTFSELEDEVQAKRQLVLHHLLEGMDDFRGLPNAVFQEQTSIVRGLLTAPASMPPEEWLAHKGRLQPKIAVLVDTRAADLRANLL